MSMSKKKVEHENVFSQILGGIREASEQSNVSDASQVPIEQLKPMVGQPRKYFDEAAANDLAVSIKEHGILQPLIVRPLQAGKYEIVAGERRYRAAKIAGLSQVPVVIRQLTDKQAAEYSLIENLQREDLNPLEETEGILRLLGLHLDMSESDVIGFLFRMNNEAKGLSNHNVMVSQNAVQVEEIFKAATRLTWQSFVANRLPILKLPTEIIAALRRGALEYTKARAIALVRDPQRRKALLERTIEKSLTLTQIKAEIKKMQHKSAGEIHPSFDRILTLSRRLKFASLDQGKERRVQELLGELEQLLKA